MRKFGTPFKIEPSNFISLGWGTGVLFRVNDPKSGAWFCYDLDVMYETNPRRHITYSDLEIHDRWYQRLWHFLARPSRRQSDSNCTRH